MSISLVSGALGGERCQFREKPFRYELRVGTTVSNGGNLTNERGLRHLQKCISGSDENPGFARFCCIAVTADSRKRVGWNPSKMDQFDNFFCYYKRLGHPFLHLQASRECKFARGG
jgi:hypothetical protein